MCRNTSWNSCCVWYCARQREISCMCECVLSSFIVYSEKHENSDILDLSNIDI